MWENDVQLEKQKRGNYMKGKAPKHTYYDKNDPGDTLTKAAAEKIMDEDKEDEEDNEWKVKKDLIEKVYFLKNELINNRDEIKASSQNYLQNRV
nr:4607_t:CDS:2 [Entrophospora candida]